MHDFRRTATPDLLRAEIDQSTAMALLGHETSEIFRRNAIKDERVLGRTAENLDRAGFGVVRAKMGQSRPGVVVADDPEVAVSY